MNLGNLYRDSIYRTSCIKSVDILDRDNFQQIGMLKKYKWITYINLVFLKISLYIGVLILRIKQENLREKILQIRYMHFKFFIPVMIFTEIDPATAKSVSTVPRI